MSKTTNPRASEIPPSAIATDVASGRLASPLTEELGLRLTKPRGPGRYTWVAPEVGPLQVEVAREVGRLCVFHDSTEIVTLRNARGGTWHAAQQA